MSRTRLTSWDAREDARLYAFNALSYADPWTNSPAHLSHAPRSELDADDAAAAFMYASPASTCWPSASQERPSVCSGSVAFGLSFSTS